MSPNFDLEDGSPSPELGFDEDSGIMAESKHDRASSDDKSPAHTSNGNNDAKPAPKSNAKDPSRPRRKKARRACFACQRAHLTCGMDDVAQGFTVSTTLDILLTTIDRR